MRSSDVVVLTVVPRELQALRSLLGVGEKPHWTSDNGTHYWFSELKHGVGKTPLTVCLCCVGEAGNPAAAAATTEALMWAQPQLAVLVGIAAGIKDKVKIGEVVLGERVVPYEKGEVRRRGRGRRQFIPEADSLRLWHNIRQDLSTYLLLEERLVERFRAAGGKFPHGDGSEKASSVTEVVRAHNAAIASGEKLLRDPMVLRAIRRRQDRKVEIGEMEAWGFAIACDRMGVGWLVSRGVSDFGDARKADKYQYFAALCAGTVALDFIEYGYTDKTGGHGKGGKRPSLAGRRLHPLRARADQACRSSDVFDLRAREARDGGLYAPDDYRDCMAGAPVRLLGQGGTGKTTFLLRSAAAAAEDGAAIACVDLGLVPGLCAEGGGFTLNSLVRSAGIFGRPEELLDGAISDSTYLFVDGVNEVPPEVAEAVLDLCWRLFTEKGVHVLVADRDEGRTHRYQTLRMEPLNAIAGTRHVRGADEGRITLDRIPLYRDLSNHLRSQHKHDVGLSDFGGSRREALEAFIRVILRNEPADWEMVASIALENYTEAASGVLEERSLLTRIDSKALRRLQDAGLLSPSSTAEPKMYGVPHQLIQDCLAAQALANRSQALWLPGIFDEVSRHRASVDALNFTMEILGEDARVEFGSRLFDWSYRTLGGILESVESKTGSSAAFSELALVVAAKYAERRLDIFADTVSEAADALARLSRRYKESRRFLGTASMADVLTVIRTHRPKFPTVERWRTVMLRSPVEVGLTELMDLDAPIPLVAWATATWLRSCPLTPRLLAHLEALYEAWRREEGKDLARWRVVHVLGAFPGSMAIEALQHALESDSYIWVLHGAIRSMFEVGYRLPDAERKRVVGWMAEVMPSLDLRRLGRVVRRASIVRQPPEGWYRDLKALAEAIGVVVGDKEGSEWALWYSQIGS